MDDTKVDMMMGFTLSSIIYDEGQASTAVQIMSGDEKAESIIAVSTASLHGFESFHSWKNFGRIDW